MTLWFGASWGAPLCAPDEHIETPVGEPCMYCDKAIEKDDQGVRMPFSRGDEVGLVAAHRYCFLLSVLPHGPDCRRCRGLERDQHLTACAYRKHGECDCEYGRVALRIVKSEMTVGAAAKELGMLEADLLDRLDLWSHRVRALKDCRQTVQLA